MLNRASGPAAQLHPLVVLDIAARALVYSGATSTEPDTAREQFRLDAAEEQMLGQASLDPTTVWPDDGFFDASRAALVALVVHAYKTYQAETTYQDNKARQHRSPMNPMVRQLAGMT